MKTTKMISPRKPKEVEIGSSKVFVRENIVENSFEYAGIQRSNFTYDETEYSHCEYVLLKMKNVPGGNGTAGSIDESRITALENSTKQHTTKITSLEAKNKQFQTSITSLQNKDNELQTNITSLQNKDNELQTSITSLQNKDTQIDGEITSLKEKDTQIDGEITKLKEKDTQLESKINENHPA